ncbi:alpha-L-fucosidase [Parascardovia denticolens]|uniref:alpha-L-fucosidase n=2 Tax=Parascardovia denticolens TaxID=78258 RepID=UPI0002E916CD|nr:alpha-L-fucosidase [Parascardovia denticolens]
MLTMQHVESVIADGPYEPTWRSLSQAKIPDWFSSAKFGIFTHWGLYSLPVFGNEWYSRNMYIQDSPECRYHKRIYGSPKDFGYKDFIPKFAAVEFDPDEWMEIIASSGAKYYFPVAEHHDGFQMYASSLSHYNSFEMGPYRDIIAELRKAALDRGIHFALSNHRAEHWWFMGRGHDFESDINEDLSRGDFYWPAKPEPSDHFDWHSTPYPNREFLTDWLLRNCELVDRFMPELVYFDWWIQHEAFKPYLKDFSAYYHNRAAALGKDVAICFKGDGMAWNSGIVDVERGGLETTSASVWQTDTAVARNSWCFTKNLDYKSTAEIIATLIDTVSKNGNLLLNIGPAGDGKIPEQDQKILKKVGRWLRANGDGIYGSKPWKKFGEGPTHTPAGSFADSTAPQWTSQDFRFTTNGGSIYVYCLNPSKQDRFVVRSFARYHQGNMPAFHGLIESVEQLGAGVVRYLQGDEGLVIWSQNKNEFDETPICFRINVN